MLYTYKFIVILKKRKCNKFFKQLIKGNVKYTKSFYTSFHYFILFWGTTFWLQHRWRVLHDLIITRVQHYVDVWVFNKTSIINLKEFIVESINYLGWESDLSTRPPRFFKYCLEVSMNTNQWKRLSWKTLYSMILPNNNAKWVSSQLFGCGRANVTEILLVYPVCYMDPLLTLYSLLCVTKWQRNRGEIFEELAKEGRSF